MEGERVKGRQRSNADFSPKGAKKDSARKYTKDEWMKFLNPAGMKLKGEVPDFSEEGWARRKPKKK